MKFKARKEQDRNTDKEDEYDIRGLNDEKENTDTSAQLRFYLRVVVTTSDRTINNQLLGRDPRLGSLKPYISYFMIRLSILYMQSLLKTSSIAHPI